jgi:hypothetical protein
MVQDKVQRKATMIVKKKPCNNSQIYCHLVSLPHTPKSNPANDNPEKGKSLDHHLAEDELEFIPMNNGIAS